MKHVPRFAALAGALALLAGCSAPDTILRTLDATHDPLSRGIADAVDRADRVFGEPRVEDRERIVRAKIAAKVKSEEGDGTSLSFPIDIRVPLPALERRFNIFLEYNSSFDDKLGDVTNDLDSNKSFTGTIMSRAWDVLDTGVKFRFYWKDGPQVGVIPFVRYESPKENFFRFWIEQQVWYKTDKDFGGKSTLQIDHVLSPKSFIRFGNAAEYYQDLKKADIEHVLTYRAPSFFASMMSADTGVAYNPHDGDPEGDSTDPDDDGDKAFAQVRFKGIMWRPWCEWEVKPYYHYLWHHDDKSVFGAEARINLLYEAYLRGPQ